MCVFVTHQWSEYEFFIPTDIVPHEIQICIQKWVSNSNSWENIKGLAIVFFWLCQPIVHLRRLKVPDDVAVFVENLFSTYFDKCSLYQLEPVIWSDRQSDVTCQTKICENSRSAPPSHPPLLFSPSQSHTQQNPADNKGLRMQCTDRRFKTGFCPAWLG